MWKWRKNPIEIQTFKGEGWQFSEELQRIEGPDGYFAVTKSSHGAVSIYQDSVGLRINPDGSINWATSSVDPDNYAAWWAAYLYSDLKAGN